MQITIAPSENPPSKKNLLHDPVMLAVIAGASYVVYRKFVEKAIKRAIKKPYTETPQ